MTARVRETELTRRHSVRTVTHINTFPQGDLNLRVRSHATILSARPTMQHAHTSRCNLVLVCHVKSLADASDARESLRMHALTYPTKPWVHKEREYFLNFRDSERVVFLPHADVTGSLLHDQTQIRFTRSPFRTSLRFVANSDARSQVDFVRISDCTRVDVLHIVPSACFRVLTHTPCILASESISFGLARLHRLACDAKEFR